MLRLYFGKPGLEPDNSAWTANIGPQGLFVTSSRLAEVGQELWLRIHLPDREVLVHGEVVWRRFADRQLRTVVRSGFGVKLNHAPEEWYLYIMRLTGAFAV